METSSLEDGWVPPALPELRIYERGNRRLCLNPEVPAWIVTSHAAALLLQLADGARTVDEIARLLTEAGVHIDPAHVRQFFAEARDMKMFAPPARGGPDVDPWRDRRLTAMHLHLTDRCNLECTYCFRDSHPGIPIRHEASRFIEMFDFIQPFCAPRMRVTYCGGEPLMYPGFRAVVEAATAHGYVNQLLTNGILITERLADFLETHFDNVKISLDGPDRESHARTRGDNFDKVLRGIERLACRKVKVIVQVTVSEANLPRVAEFRPLVPPNVKLSFTPMLPMGRGADEGGFLSDEQFLAVTRVSAADPTRGKEPQFISGVASRACHAGLSNVSIADTGDVYPCHLFHMAPFHLGNIFHDNFEGIFYGDKLREYVRQMDVGHNNSICSSCEMRFLCGGGCKANTLHASGDFRGVDLYCGFIKRSIVDGLFDSVDEAAPAATAAGSEVVSSL